MTVRRSWRKDFRELAKPFGGAQTTTIYSAFGMCCAWPGARSGRWFAARTGTRSAP